MIQKLESLTKIFVVDPQPDDYIKMVQEEGDHIEEYHFFKSGREALRKSPDDEPNLWVINTDLPDMSGTDLYGMLQTLGSTAPAALISDTYRVENEISARTSGAALYFTKPLHSEWLLAATQATA